ncbi:MAG: glycosyltransferase family 4 protein [Candidatus Omnitrophota bacterium]|jgi:glycosyltransferase involved in cell wall biosynthesis
MGGVQVHCQTLSEMAVLKGHCVTIITTKHPKGLEYEEKNGCNVYYLPNTRSARFSKSWWRESAKKITQLHKKEPFDIIWAEHLSGYYYTWKIKPKLKIPIITINQAAGILGHIRSEWSRISSPGEFFSFMVKYLPEAIVFYFLWFWRALKYSDMTVGVSDQTVEIMKKEFGIDPRRLSVVYDGIDTELFKPDKYKRELIRNRFSLNEKQRVLIMSGVVHKQKGMHIGLKAFVKIKKLIPELKMMIVGDGPHLESLKRLVKELGIEDDIIFCGCIPNQETPLYYNVADLFINPTLRVEALSLVTIEAMSCSLPVVVSCIGGTQSTIDDGISGYFVKPKDIKSLVKKTIQILKNPTLSKSMGGCGRQKVIEKFSREKMIADYLDISQKLINQKE